MINKKYINFLLLSILAYSSAQSQDLQVSLPVGVQSQVPLKIKPSADSAKCNIEISVPGQNKFEREMSAPEFETLIEFTPPNEGVFSIEWKGKLKRRGLNSVLGCDAAGKVIVAAKPGASEIAAKWNDYFAKVKPEASECVKIGLDINQITYESTDPSAKLVAPTDPIVKPVFEKCDSFLRAKQPQQNFACTISGSIKTFCDNQYAERGADGRLRAISRSDAIKLHLNGREWSLGNTETAEAKTNRLRLEEEAKNRQTAEATIRAEESKANTSANAATTKLAATDTKDNLSRPPNPLLYGTCYGAIVGWAKKSQGGLIPNQRAVDFHKTWQPYAAQVSSAAIKAGGCVGNFTDAQLLQCYKKRLPDERDANFQYAYNLGIEAPGGAAGAASIAENQCSQLIGNDNKPRTTSSSSGSSNMAQRVAAVLGSEKIVACMYVSARYVGLLSSAPVGSDQAAMRVGFMAQSKVFGGLSKIANPPLSEGQSQVQASMVKNASLQSLKQYYDQNCSMPEILELAKIGFN